MKDAVSEDILFFVKNSLVKRGNYDQVHDAVKMVIWFSQNGMMVISSHAGDLIAYPNHDCADGIFVGLLPDKEDNIEAPLLYAESKDEELLHDDESVKDVFLYRCGYEEDGINSPGDIYEGKRINAEDIMKYING